jgi:CIC family chloride channel protein
MPWYGRLMGPIIGGAVVAVMLRFGVGQGWGPSPRAFGLWDVVASRRLRGTIRATTLSLRDGFLSALIAVVSLGSGASSGRESPAMHLGASIAMLPGRLFGLDLPERRLLVAMGVAAGFGAVLHAPLAGVFIARELIVPRLRFHALGPVALASVTAWLMASWAFNGAPVLAIPVLGKIPTSFYITALIVTPLLAMFAWSAAFLWTRAPRMVEQGARRIHVPVWTLPAIGGVLLGVFAMGFPQAIGVGYEPLVAGLAGQYSALLMPILALAKIAASTVTFAFRFGGGPIAPSLYVGAMIGATLGAAAGLALGDPSSAQVFFGLIGMAVAMAVLLEAPFTAAILVFELSGAPAIGAAALVAALSACFLVRRFAPSSQVDEPEITLTTA